MVSSFGPRILLYGVKGKYILGRSKVFSSLSSKSSLTIMDEADIIVTLTETHEDDLK